MVTVDKGDYDELENGDEHDVPLERVVDEEIVDVHSALIAARDGDEKEDEAHEGTKETGTGNEKGETVVESRTYTLAPRERAVQSTCRR